mgnify:FL=1
MKKTTLLAAAFAAVVLSSGCCVMPNTAVMAPLDMGTTSGEYYDASVKPLKTGKATVQGVLFFTQGDASVRAAMANGGITKINRIERETKNILCIIATYTTIVYGE